MNVRVLASSFLVTSFLAASAFAAGTGSEGYFDIHNNTEQNILIGFYTNDGSGWSANWIDGSQVEPSQVLTAQFTADTGNCDQTLQVGWLSSDGGEVLDEPIGINICDASNVYLDDNEIYYD